MELTRRVCCVLLFGVAFAGPVVWPETVGLVAAQTGGVQTPPPASGRGPAPPRVGTGLILGQVVDGVTGDPIADAVVSPGPARAPAQGTPTSALNTLQPIVTGADGRFVFRDLPPGSYAVTASLDGFVNGMVGQGRPGGPDRAVVLADGERIGDANIRLWKHAAITGSVVDELGEPAVELTMRVFRRLTVDGRPQLQQTNIQQARTDDRGRFRFARLTPGDYVVVAPVAQSTMPTAVYDALIQAIVTNSTAPPDWYMDLMLSGGGSALMQASPVRIGDLLWSSSVAGTAPPPDAGRATSYRTTYYPSATSSAQASVVTVRPGEERTGIDLQMALVATARVSGTVRSSSGPMANLNVRLLPAQVDPLALMSELEIGGAVTRADGSFTLVNVPAGQYVLRVVKAARSEMMARMMAGEGIVPSAAPLTSTLAGEQFVALGDTDVTGVSIVMREGPKVSGRVEFELTPPRTAAQMIAGIGVMLAPLGGQSGIAGLIGGDPAMVDADGRFRTLGHPPDKYILSFGQGRGRGPGIKSVTAGGRDMTNALFDLRDADITDVVIKVSDRLGALSGVVRGPNGLGAPMATAILFPADYRTLLTNGLMPGRVQTVAASRAGAFTVTGIVPGEYLVVAMDDADVADNQDSGFFESLARAATRVTIGDGEKKSQDLILTKVKR